MRNELNRNKNIFQIFHIFILIQHIPHLSCKFDHFWKKKDLVYAYMQNTEETIAKYAGDTNLFRLGSTNPKQNNQPLDVY